MATDVVMPQMGESIAEGTIVRWIKKVGDKVDRDEPLFEISTDKVDAEIPSPAAGVVTEIRVKEGETVPVNSVVAIIGVAGSAASPSAPASKTAAPVAAAAPSSTASQASAASAGQAPQKTIEPPKPSPQADGTSISVSPASTAAPVSKSAEAAASGGAAREKLAETLSTEDALHQRSSPLVRKIAKEHHVDISQIHGTGIAGRVTKDDILGFIGSASAAPQPSGSSARLAAAAPAATAASPRPAAAGDRVEKM